MTLILLPHQQISVPDTVTRLGVLNAQAQNRSQWSVRFTDGTITSEWDEGADWVKLKRFGRQAVRLYAPNGKFAELGDTKDATDRIFQFKVAVRTVGHGAGVLAHVIGLIWGTNGECDAYAWEPGPDGGRIVGPWTDAAWNFRYHQIGKLEGWHLGISNP